MRRGTFVAIRHRADGSLYFPEKTPFWSALRESIAIVLFIVVALVLLEIAIVRSSATRAQEANCPVANKKTRQAAIARWQLTKGMLKGDTHQ